MIKLEKSWNCVLKDEFKKQYMLNLKNFLYRETKIKTIYPAGDNIFRSLNQTPFQNVRVVILGQDPYHGHGQANGLCFSVNKSVSIPPSLLNIFKEIKLDLNIKMPEHGDLSPWSSQGVLLLNSILTVEKDRPNSHKNKGWEIFTDAIIKKLNDRKDKNIIFVFWGRYAKSKIKNITNKKHIILQSSHPSPFSARSGFFGCKHFSLINKHLSSFNEPEIEWRI